MTEKHNQDSLLTILQQAKESNSFLEIYEDVNAIDDFFVGKISKLDPSAETILFEIQGRFWFWNGFRVIRFEDIVRFCLKSNYSQDVEKQTKLIDLAIEKKLIYPLVRSSKNNLNTNKLDIVSILTEFKTRHIFCEIAPTFKSDISLYGYIKWINDTNFCIETYTSWGKKFDESIMRTSEVRSICFQNDECEYREALSKVRKPTDTLKLAS